MQLADIAVPEEVNVWEKGHVHKWNNKWITRGIKNVQKQTM